MAHSKNEQYIEGLHLAACMQRVSTLIKTIHKLDIPNKFKQNYLDIRIEILHKLELDETTNRKVYLQVIRNRDKLTQDECKAFLTRLRVIESACSMTIGAFKLGKKNERKEDEIGIIYESQGENEDFSIVMKPGFEKIERIIRYTRDLQGYDSDQDTDHTICFSH